MAKFFGQWSLPNPLREIASTLSADDSYRKIASREYLNTARDILADAHTCSLA